MKKIVFLLFLSILAAESFAQTKSIEELKRDEIRFNESITVLHIQLIGDESFDASGVKFRLVIGENKKFYIKDKNDFDILDGMKRDVFSISSIPDALDYLRDIGYEVELYSSVILNGVIRHNFILSKVSM